MGQYPIENKGLSSKPLVLNPPGSQKSRLAILYLLFSSQNMLSESHVPGGATPYFRPSPDTIQRPRLFLENLSKPDQANLTDFWGADGLNQLLSLAYESDGEIFQEDLLNVGRHLRRRDRLPAALLILQFMADQSKGEFSNVAPKVQEERNAMVGNGPWGPRLEFIAEQTVKQIADPALLAAMWADQYTFSWVRRGIAIKFLRPTMTGSYRVSRNGKILSNLGGFAAEVPAFAMTHQGVAQLLGQEAKYHDVKDAILGTYLLRGGMWLGGGLGRGLGSGGLAVGNQLAQRIGLTMMSRPFLVRGVSSLGNFLGAYSGIVVGGGLEMAKAYHLPFNLDALFNESFLTYLHFRAMRH